MGLKWIVGQLHATKSYKLNELCFRQYWGSFWAIHIILYAYLREYYLELTEFHSGVHQGTV